MLLTDNLLTDNTITTPISLDETYTLRVLSDITKKINDPVNIKLRDSTIYQTLPFDDGSVDFIYTTISTPIKKFIGSIDTDIFYPVNSAIRYNDMTLKIISIDKIISTNGKKSLNITATLTDVIVTLPERDSYKENDIKRNLTAIFEADNNLKTLMTNYNSKMLYAFNGDETDPLIEMTALNNAINNLVDIDQINHLTSTLAVILSGGSSTADITTAMTALNNVIGGSLYSISYFNAVHKVSIYSLIRWFLMDQSIVYGQLFLPYVNNGSITYTTGISMTVQSPNAISLTITPQWSQYNYIISMSELTSTQITTNYNDYTLGTLLMTCVNKNTNNSVIISSISGSDNYNILSTLLSSIFNGSDVLN